MPRVLFVQEHREVTVEPGRTIREIALEVGINPNRKYQRLISCEGHGIFDGCKCWVKDSGARTHRVEPGESLAAVADRYGVALCDVMAVNGMKDTKDANVQPGTTLSIPGLAPKTFAERAFHRLLGWQRLACQARVMGDIEVWTMPQGDERLRLPRTIAPRPANPEKRTRFLESRFRTPPAPPAPANEKPEAPAAKS